MKRAPKFEIYKDRKGKWRWRMIAGNGRVMATSGESFSQYHNAYRAAVRIKLQARSAELKKDHG